MLGKKMFGKVGLRQVLPYVLVVLILVVGVGSATLKLTDNRIVYNESPLVQIGFNATSGVLEFSGNVSFDRIEHYGETASYIVFKEGDMVFCKNGTNGLIEYSSSNATAVIQYAIDNLDTNGGKIFIKAGGYEVTGLSLSGKDYIILEGEGYSTYIYLSPTGTVSTLLNIPDYSNFCKISNIRFSANGRSQYIIYSYGKHTILEISGCYFDNIGGQIGLAICRGRDLYFHDNYIYANNANKNNDAAAIYTDYAIITNNIFYQTAGSGDLLTAAQVKHMIVSDNVFHTTTTTNSGVFLETNLGNIHDVNINHNTFDNCNCVIRGQTGQSYVGERISIVGNTFENGGNIDVRILSATSGDIGKLNSITIGNNRLDNGDILIQGIKNITVHDNILENGNITITSPNENILFKNNIGFVTENSGSATITSGSTSVTVSHGLAGTPDVVTVTPSGNLTVWVDSLTSSSFTIHCYPAPSSDTTVYWVAEYKP